MELDQLTLFKMRTITEILDCVEHPETKFIDDVLDSFKQEGLQSFGMDETTCLSMFSELLMESTTLKEQMEKSSPEAIRKEKENLEAQQENRIVTRWAIALTLLTELIYFLLSFHIQMGFWNWLKDWGWVLLVVAQLYFLYFFVVTKIYESIHIIKSMDALRDQIKQNEQWVWHCQRCTANYAYNGELNAVCGRCHNSLTKVRGMRI